MALPPTIQQVTVNFGPFVDFEGNPLGGSTTFTPSTSVLHAATGTPVLNKPITVTWDLGGSGTKTLPATDDTGLTPTGFVYYVTHRFNDRNIAGPNVTAIALPSAVPEVDLDLLIPVTGASGLQISLPAVLSVGGKTGVVTGDDLASLPEVRAASASAAGDAAADPASALRTALGGVFAPPSTTVTATAALGLSTRGVPVKRRPVERVVGYYGKAGHGYTVSAPAGVGNLNDTSQPGTGTQSMSAALGASQTAQFDVGDLAPFTVVGRNVQLRYRANAGITGIIVYLASDTGSGLSNRIQLNMFNASFGLDQDVVVEFPIGEFGVIATPDLTQMRRVRILVQAGTSGGTIYLYDLSTTKDATTTLPNGAVTISADDSHLDHWTYLRPKLAEKGYAATLYPNIAALGQAGAYTVAQAQHMQRVHGFDIGSHALDTAHHVDHIAQTEAWLRDHFERIITANKLNGFRGDSFAWPNATNDALARRIAADYFSSARGGISYSEISPPTDPMNTKAINAAAGTLAVNKAYVDKAKAGHAVAHFFFHALPVTKVATNDTARQDFYDLIDYIAAQGVPVITQAQFMALPVS